MDRRFDVGRGLGPSIRFDPSDLTAIVDRVNSGHFIPHDPCEAILDCLGRKLTALPQYAAQHGF
jgi:hypothetical protein